MLSLTLPKIEMAVWMPILGSGVGFPIASDTSLQNFLCSQIEIRPEYLELRIQTILVNGQAIDDVGQVDLVDGDVIALSAAMPGLAGATLRKGSHLADMRRTITHSGGALPTKRGKEGVITLKLFNLVAREIGPSILDGPVFLKNKDLCHLSARYPSAVAPQNTTHADNWVAVKLITKSIAEQR